MAPHSSDRHLPTLTSSLLQPRGGWTVPLRPGLVFLRPVGRHDNSVVTGVLRGAAFPRPLRLFAKQTFTLGERFLGRNLFRCRGFRLLVSAQLLPQLGEQFRSAASGPRIRFEELFLNPAGAGAIFGQDPIEFSCVVGQLDSPVSTSIFTPLFGAAAGGVDFA